FAAWQHPKQFKGVDLTKDFAKFHEDYLPFGYRGVFFVTLKK
ncbi:ferrisiderophore receptor Irp6A, partial [Muribaculaceae bacterium Isolate-002 (NCI)]